MTPSLTRKTTKKRGRRMSDKPSDEQESTEDVFLECIDEACDNPEAPLNKLLRDARGSKHDDKA